MNWLASAIVANLLGSLLLTFVYFYLYLQDRKRYLWIWTLSWFAYFLRFGIGLMTVSGKDAPWLIIANQVAALISGLLLLWGTYVFIEKRLPRLWLYVSAAGILWIVISVAGSFSFLAMAIPSFTFLGIVYVWTGTILMKSRTLEGPEKKLVGMTFIAWGIHKMDYPFLRPITAIAPWGYILGAFLEFAVALGILLVYFQKMRREIQEKETRFRELSNLLPQVVYECDERGTLTFANQEAFKLFGYTEEDFRRGLNVAEMLMPEHREVAQGRIRALLGGDPIERGFQYLAKRKDGSTLPVEVYTNAIVKEGKTVGLRGIMINVTERKLAEEAVRKSEERFEALFEQAADGIFILDSSGKLLSVNRSFAMMHGFTVEEMLCMGLAGIDVEGATPVPERIRRLKAGETLSFEVEHYHKDGHTIPLAVKANLIQSGQDQLIIAIHRDLTEFRRSEAETRALQERLQRAEKMEALGLLAGGVAHDLNNSLGILVGYAELLCDTLDESDPRKEDVRNIIVGGERSAAIVQDLLTLARRGVQTKVSINLNKTIAEYLKSPEFVKLTSLYPHIRIRTELEKDLLKMNGSAVHLSKSLMNLVSNAAEAMTSGGEILIRTANRYLDRPVAGYDVLAEGDYVTLSVTDTGEGISTDDMKHIFEPFYTKKAMGRSGTGLGLSVVWGTVKDHSGYIDVESQKGAGSTFHLYFPVTQEAEAAEDTQASKAPCKGHGERILVVDDIEGQRNLAKRILEKLNYNVDTAVSGEEALAYLKRRPVDLVILDMIMDPGIDGFETYRQIREIHPSLRCIIVSGFAETERVAMAQALGAGPFVKKPYLLEKIGLAVRRELDR